MEMTPAEIMNHIFDERVLMQRWLDVEVSLAKAEAEMGLIPAEAAIEISKQGKLELLDMAVFNETMQRVGHPMMAMIAALQATCKGDTGQYIHWGVTSQDIIDTSNVLRLKDAFGVVYGSLRQIENNLLNLAEKHADTIMVGRTHCNHAIPTTFGFKVAIWARQVRRDVIRLQECQDRLLVGNITGAIGTMASFEGKGSQVQELTLKDLGLGVPDVCWHAARDRSAEFAHILAMIASVIGRIAGNIKLLMATEVDEVSEWREGQVGSSTMPQKHNPAISEVVVAEARKIRYLAAMVTESILVDHERDMNFWHAEINPLAEILLEMGDLLTNGLYLTEDLTVFPLKMRENLDIQRGLVMSERVMLEMGKRVGKQNAHKILSDDATRTFAEGLHFKEVLLDDSRVTEVLNESEIDSLLDPSTYLGIAPQKTRELVALSREEREKDRKITFGPGAGLKFRSEPQGGAVFLDKK